MLSKNNKILVGCLALLLVMSVGYALFSDTIEINGSATAKGDFNLVTTCDEAEPVNDLNSGSVTDATITCNDNIVNASATLDYPGSKKWFRIKVKNEGTISAKLKEVVELNNPDLVYFKRGEGWSGSYIENCQGDKTNQACAILYQGDEIYTNYEEPSTAIEPDWSFLETEDPTLEPGETAYFYIEMNWYSSSTVSGEPLTPTLNAEITWEQVTEN